MVCITFHFRLLFIITGSIARSAKRRYFSYSEADFEVFRPAGAIRGTDGSEIWHGGPPCLISPHQCNDKGIEPKNWNFYWNLIKMWNINAPQGRIPCAIFTEFKDFVVRRFKNCTPFHVALAVKISLDVLKGL